MLFFNELSGQTFPNGLTDEITVKEVYKDTIGEIIWFSPKLGLDELIRKTPEWYKNKLKFGLENTPLLNDTPWNSLDTIISLDYCITVEESIPAELHCRGLKYTSTDTAAFTFHLILPNTLVDNHIVTGRGAYVKYVSSTTHFHLFNPVFTKSDLLKSITQKVKVLHPNEKTSLPHLNRIIQELDPEEKDKLKQYSEAKQLEKFIKNRKETK